MYRKNKDLEKSLAKSFVAFLESENRKEDMPFQQLKQIYEKEFRPLCGIPNISFSRIINALSYDLNQCQRLQDRVVFGGGEQAALQLLATGGADDSSEDENEDGIPRLYCKICKRHLGNVHAYHTHMASVRHRQQGCLQKIRKSLEKADLVCDKNGINVTSVPPGDENGVVELCVQMGVAGRIELIIKNTGEDTITVQDITLLWSVNIFDYSEIRNVGEHNIQLVPGRDTKFNIGCKRRREYGYSYVPAVITFKTTDNVEFHILRFLSVRIVSDLYDYLKQTSVYKPPPKAVRIPMDVVTIPGISLPPLARNGLVMWRKPKNYEIPPTIKAQIIKSNKVAEGLKERLRKTLTFGCYQEKFSTLLYIEELQMQKDIRKYDMKEVEFQQDREDRRFLLLEVPGLAENRPSVLRGDKIFAYESGVLKRRYEGIVHKVQQLDVKLGFRADMPFVKGKKFDIQFTFTRLPIQMEHRACENIASLGSEMRPVLFPQEGDVEQLETFNGQFRYYDRNLNSEQQLAVQRIVSGSSLPAPYLVFGPPGTGKTVTLVEAIKQVHRLIDSSIILACAPENSAADLLVERLLDHVDKGKIFRMYAASRPWDFVPQKLKEARVVNFDSVRHDVFYPSKEELMTDYRIIVTTLVTAGRLVSADFPRNHFTHIFIDEAGHATEPECIIPVANLLDPASGQLVLAGDPKQLGPIIRSPISQEHGLETSLLERLMTTCNSYSRNSVGSYDSKLLTKLLNNYRSHRAIIEIPKQMFYDDELNECAGDFRNVMLDWEELPNKTFPIIFHPVYGKDEREANSPSFFNVAEVDTIERYLKKLLDDNVRSRRLKHLSPEMIGVISPYKRQVQKIQKMIEKRRFLKGIKVGSVEEFQGQERRIIILSTVRSTKKEFLEMDKDFHLGFLHNPKRFNVAITRAQALLILIGNPDMLSLDENWMRFLDYCRINNACVDVERKGTVEDIAETLRRLNLMSAESSESCDDSEISLRQHVEHPEWKRRE
ncbi:putative helicase mov-10-B.1 [Montipora foliosa]|uniref:putative helicase mov-10-B.1 n=1 Tax=Montipora foliosa TaxID=591990 RepID=UPI0035F124FD